MNRSPLLLLPTVVLSTFLLSTFPVGAACATTFTTINNPLADPNGEGTVLFGVSGNNVVGEYYDASNEANGFEFNTTTGAWTPLLDPSAAPVASGGGTIPFGISGKNIVGAFSDTSDNEHGFLYDGTAWTTLDDPSSNDSSGTIATGIYGNYVAGYYYTSGAVAHGFLYNMTSHAWMTLDDPVAGHLGTFVWGIGGNYAVGLGLDGGGGFLYDISTGTWTNLQDPLGAFGVDARGISGTDLVGVDNVAAGSKIVSEGVIFDMSTNTWTALQNPAADLTVSSNPGTTALGVDGDLIVGWYSSQGPGGPILNGFEAVVPEPSSIVLLALGAIAVAILRRPFGRAKHGDDSTYAMKSA